MENAITGEDVAVRIARLTRERRGGLDYPDEVRRLLAAAVEVMRNCGIASRPRVADIVATAGLSNEAFYRHFPSKEALVEALLDDGAQQLGSYLAHQMAKEPSPRAQVRRWIEGVMSQANEEVAATTLAVLWNGGTGGKGLASGRHFASSPLATLLREPLAALGCADPETDASLVSHAILGKLSDYLWKHTQPTQAEIEHMTTFCVAAATVTTEGHGHAGIAEGSEATELIGANEGGEA